MSIRLTALLLFCLSVQLVKGQQFVCGTVVPPNAQQQEQRMAINSTFNYQSISTCLHKTLSIHFIIVTDSLNNTGITVPAINAAVQSLNTWFAPICLSFQVCSIDTVHAYKYDQWDRTLEEAEFTALYGKENVINVVLVTNIVVPGGAAGYAPLGISMPAAPRRDLICINKASLAGKTFPHEMGHFFGLYHTFETSLGVEFVNEKNCATTGDLLCDTPADINPAPVSAACIWTGTNRDPNGDMYTPLLGDIMSYHPAACVGSFTIGQYNRMIFSYLNFRNYLY
jgi:hypothetical protein